MPYILIVVLAAAAAVLIFAICRKKGGKTPPETNPPREEPARPANSEDSKAENVGPKVEPVGFNAESKKTDPEAEFLSADNEDAFVIGEMDDNGNIVKVERIPLDEFPDSKPDSTAQDKGNDGKDE